MVYSVRSKGVCVIIVVPLMSLGAWHKRVRFVPRAASGYRPAHPRGVHIQSNVISLWRPQGRLIHFRFGFPTPFALRSNFKLPGCARASWMLSAFSEGYERTVENEIRRNVSTSTECSPVSHLPPRHTVFSDPSDRMSHPVIHPLSR